MKILFHTNSINYRGTTVAVTDYAKYNQEILGNESIICYDNSIEYSTDMGTEQKVVDSLSENFKVIGTSNIQDIINQEKPDILYMITSGAKNKLPRKVKTCIHAVFTVKDPHGNRYAYISEWLSQKMSNGKIPYVPHIVTLPKTTEDYRDFFKISKDDIVIGRIGGYTTFDIPFVKNKIMELCEHGIKFLFVNTEPFIKHDNVIHIGPITSQKSKAKFINTCDGMIHARRRGESFGLSICEFLHQNKPVLACSMGIDQNHVSLLSRHDTLYNDSTELENMILNIRNIRGDYKSSVIEFEPYNVMQKFKEVFIDEQ